MLILGFRYVVRERTRFVLTGLVVARSADFRIRLVDGWIAKGLPEEVTA